MLLICLTHIFVARYTDTLLGWWLVTASDYARLKMEDESGHATNASISSGVNGHSLRELRLATGLDAVYARSMRRIVLPVSGHF